MTDRENLAPERPYDHFDHTRASQVMPTDPRTFLPLKPVDLQLLLALADEEMHGYGLVQAIADRTDGLVTLEPGNLYRIIKRLLADGLVAESDRRVTPGLDDERRRYYRLTALGGRVVAAEIRRLQTLVSSRSVRALVRRWAT
jgi:DNA-binding PadR family transcriptional regulator